MNCRHHDALGDPSCRTCQEAHGWSIRLTPDEQDELRNRLIRGEKVALAGLSFADQCALRPFVHKGGSVDWPSRTTAAEGTSTPEAGEPNRLAEIASKITSLERSGFTDPLGFLRDAPLDAVARVLGPDDFDYVARLREQRARPAPKVEPPAPSREAITAEVLRRHSEGQDAVQIAREMKTGRTLAQYIIDQNTK